MPGYASLTRPTVLSETKHYYYWKYMYDILSIKKHCLPLFLCLLTLCSCSRIYWDENWIWQEMYTLAKEQEIRIETEPPARVFLDGEPAGQTPVTLRLPYHFKQVRLVRHQYKESGGKKEVLDRKLRLEDVIAKSAHTLRFTASGYHDHLHTLRIPADAENLNIFLRKKSGLHYPLDCSLQMTAPPDFFPEIEEIIAQNAIIPKSEQAAVPFGPDLLRRTFRFRVKDVPGLDRLTDILQGEARSRQVYFRIHDAEMQAVFTANPSREFRAVWLSYLDWPGEERDPARQQQILKEMLDSFQQLHINAVFFHARMEGDAWYPSDLVPWSRILTGQQGQHPGYDPLAFAIREARQRGIELHAWLNPYRTRMSQQCGKSYRAANHISRKQPDWLLHFRWPGGCYEMLDPGLPEVRARLIRIVDEIVAEYDVDGIHFDDMFYPYPQKGFGGIRSEDRESYRKYGKGMHIADWRRQNVNTLIRDINTVIKKRKPYVRFGISPFGIHTSGEFPGTRGMAACQIIYSDALAWLADKSVDYLAPQLYWKTRGNPAYAPLLSWWAEKVNKAGRHIYPGQILYYVGKPETGANRPESAEEITEQMQLNREMRQYSVLGNSFYRALSKDNFLLGPEELKEELRSSYYAAPALPPQMPWLDQTPPLPPRNLRIVKDAQGEQFLQWEDANPRVIKYGLYLVYRENAEKEEKMKTVGGLLAICGEKKWKIAKELPLREGDIFFVTALSRNNVESPGSVPLCYGGK
ncbi:MAG: family 10 glycosylhydrolase [Desulfococcaceae bacterium]|nr:family 10 glycosylhydrolase [Desulfococcaceae bacterium]